MRIGTRLALATSLVALFNGLLSAAPPPTPGTGMTPPPSKCAKVMYHAMLSAVGTIKPATPGNAPAGACSQITITAWRNNYDYNCKDPITPHETTTAIGPDLNNCSYDLPVEMGHMVTLKATTTIPGWRVVLSYKDKSEDGGFIWEEKHPVTFNWLLKPKFIVTKTKDIQLKHAPIKK